MSRHVFPAEPSPMQTSFFCTVAIPAALSLCLSPAPSAFSFSLSLARARSLCLARLRPLICAQQEGGTNDGLQCPRNRAKEGREDERNLNKAANVAISSWPPRARTHT